MRRWKQFQIFIDQPRYSRSLTVSRERFSESSASFFFFFRNKTSPRVCMNPPVLDIDSEDTEFRNEYNPNMTHCVNRHWNTLKVIPLPSSCKLKFNAFQVRCLSYIARYEPCAWRSIINIEKTKTLSTNFFCSYWTKRRASQTGPKHEA